MAVDEAVLGQLSRNYILRSLETGLMSSVGRQLAKKERIAVAHFLSTVESTPQKSRGGYCTGQPAAVSNAPGWTSWGVDLENRRLVAQAGAGEAGDVVIGVVEQLGEHGDELFGQLGGR